jgi:DNA-binding CsgD family transcriptional regulator
MLSEFDFLSSSDHRLLETLEQLLALPGLELRTTLDQASSLVAEAVGADKVDVFLYQADSDSLVALGTSDTPLGRLQHELGLDRFPQANAGPLTAVFETGEPYHTGHADQDPTQPRGIVEALGVRSQFDAPVNVNGERRGVLAVVSQQPDHFTGRDQRFLLAVAAWIGLMTHRSELHEQATREASELGRRAAGDEVGRLPRRQQELAACVAEGLTNDEIAQRLTLVPGTVANHIAQILQRLSLTGRVQIAVWAVEHGLYRSEWGNET